jgi:hypothetical protein
MSHARPRDISPNTTSRVDSSPPTPMRRAALACGPESLPGRCRGRARKLARLHRARLDAGTTPSTCVPRYAHIHMRAPCKTAVGKHAGILSPESSGRRSSVRRATSLARAGDCVRNKRVKLKQGGCLPLNTASRVHSQATRPQIKRIDPQITQMNADGVSASRQHPFRGRWPPGNPS